MHVKGTRACDTRDPEGERRTAADRVRMAADAAAERARRSLRQHPLVRVYHVVIFYISWVLFGGVGLMLNVVCAFMLLLPRRVAYGSTVRATIRWLFDLWLKWTHFAGSFAIDWRGFDQPLSRGTVYIANHPGLLDAVFLLSRLPDAICIFKPKIMRNPALGPAAIMAGYVAGDTGVELIRTVAEKLAAGRSLLIFPEGTRTAPGTRLGTLKAGFALIAARARAPVQLIVIRASLDLIRRGRAPWKPPAILPAHAEITLDQRWEHDPLRHATDLVGEIEQRLLTVLPAPYGPDLVVTQKRP